MRLLEGEHAVQDTAFAVGFRRLLTLVEDRVEAFFPPAGVGQRIEAEPGRVVGDQAHAGIDDLRVGAAGQPGMAGQIELTRRVVAGVAGDAAPVEQRPHLGPVIRRAADRGGRAIEARRVGRAETVVEFQRTDDGGATGEESQEKRGQQAHAVNLKGADARHVSAVAPARASRSSAQRGGAAPGRATNLLPFHLSLHCTKTFARCRFPPPTG